MAVLIVWICLIHVSAYSRSRKRASVKEITACLDARALVQAVGLHVGNLAGMSINTPSILSGSVLSLHARTRQ